jgi:hypothetical protein
MEDALKPHLCCDKGVARIRQVQFQSDLCGKAEQWVGLGGGVEEGGVCVIEGCAAFDRAACSGYTAEIG